MSELIGKFIHKLRDRSPDQQESSDLTTQVVGAKDERDSYKFSSDWTQAEFGGPQYENPDDYTIKLVNEIEKSFRYDPRPSRDLTPEEIRLRNTTADRKHMMISFVMRKALEGSNDANRDILVGKLNEWFTDDKLNHEDETSTLLNLADYANLDTIHRIIDKISVFPWMGDNRVYAWILMSRAYEKFKGDPKLEAYLDEFTGDGMNAKAATAIREGKRLREAGGPYMFGLAIDEDYDPEVTTDENNAMNPSVI